MTPAEEKTIASARRRIRRSRFAIPLLVLWVITLGVLIRLGNAERGKIDRQPLALQEPYRTNAKRYLIAVSFVFLSGVFCGSLFASPTDRLLVKLADEKTNPL